MAAPNDPVTRRPPEVAHAEAHASAPGASEDSLDSRGATPWGSAPSWPQAQDALDVAAAAAPCAPRPAEPAERRLTLSHLPEEMTLLILRHLSRCSRLPPTGGVDGAVFSGGGEGPRRAGGFEHALVCRAWRALAPEAQEYVAVPEGAALAAEQLTRGAMPFPNLSVLSFGRASLEELSPQLLVELLQEFPNLTHLRVSSKASLAPCGASSSAEALIGALAAGAPRLKSIELEGLLQRSRIPDSIAAMRCLETLVLEGAEVLDVPPGLSQLCALRTLKLKCSDPAANMALFRGLHSLRLQELSLDVMYLRELPAEIGGLTTLRKLGILGNAIRELPLSILRLTGLRCLSLRCCQLERLPEGIGAWGGLKSLVLATPKLIALPDSVESFKGLTSLRVEAQDLPLSWLQGLTALKSLHLGNLKASALALDFAAFPCLRSLTLDCPQLKELPGGVDVPGRLRHLDISSCRDLSLSAYQACTAPGFASVTRLDVGGALRSCLEHVGAFSGVYELHISNLHLDEIPDSIRGLARLAVLRLECCWRVVTLDSVLKGVPSLRQLSIKFCRLLEELCGTVSADMALEQLSIEHCCNFKRLPAGFHRFTLLRSLVLKDCAVLEGFPDVQGEHGTLTRVSVANCPMFASFPGSFSNAYRSLQELSLMNLPSFSSLPDSFGQLQQLRVLVLERLPLLRCLPESSQHLKGLTSLVVTDCPQLTLGHTTAMPSLSRRSRGLVSQRTG